MSKAVIFDYDGVIVDSYDVLLKAYIEIAKRFAAKPILTKEELHRIYLWSHHDVEKVLGIVTPEQKAQATKIYREESSRLKDEIILVPGIKEVIEQLAKTHILGICSATSRKLIEERLQHYGLLKYFSAIVASEDVKNYKPAPDALLACLEKLGIKAEDAVFIGDMALDILMGKAAKVKTIAFCSDCSWGSEDLVQKQNPDITIKKAEQLLTVVS